MTGAIAATADLDDVAEAVTKALTDTPQPLTLGQLKDCLPGDRLSDQRLRGVLATLEQLGRVFRCSPQRGSPRFWGRDEEQLATEKLLELLRDGPRTAALLAFGAQAVRGPLSGYKLPSASSTRRPNVPARSATTRCYGYWKLGNEMRDGADVQIFRR